MTVVCMLIDSGVVQAVDPHSILYRALSWEEAERVRASRDAADRLPVLFTRPGDVLSAEEWSKEIVP